MVTSMQGPIISDSSNKWLLLQRRLTKQGNTWTTNYFGKEFCVASRLGLLGRPQMGVRGLLQLEPVLETTYLECLPRSPDVGPEL